MLEVPSGTFRFWWKCSVDHPPLERSMGATRMDVPGARRVHLTEVLLLSEASVRVSSLSFWMVHASVVIDIVDDS